MCKAFWSHARHPITPVVSSHIITHHYLSCHQAEAAQAAEAERQRREEAARLVAEAQAAARREAEKVASVERRREAKRAALPAEPAPGPGTAQIRIRLPDGTNCQRRFLSDQHTVQTLFDFVDSLEAASFAKYALASSFPKRLFDAASDGALTLVQAGLAPQAALFVQPAADDEEDEAVA